jgi:hypothetical protein
MKLETWNKWGVARIENNLPFCLYQTIPLVVVDWPVSISFNAWE